MNKKFKPSVPVTIFTSSECEEKGWEHDSSWNEFVSEIFHISADLIHEKDFDVMFASAYFEDDKRQKDKALHSGMLMLEVDGKSSVEAVRSALRKHRLRGALYDGLPLTLSS